MEIERATRHRSHFLSNVAIQLDGDKAEVECYGIASSTLDGDMLNVFGGRYLNEFARVGTEWRMCRSEYVLDHHFSAPMPSLGDAMGGELGTGLDSTHPLFRKLYTKPLRLRRLGLVAGFASLRNICAHGSAFIAVDPAFRLADKCYGSRRLTDR